MKPRHRISVSCLRSLRSLAALLLAVALFGLAGCDRTQVRTTTFADGSPWTRIHLREGVLHGQSETWYANGKQRSRSAYVNGVPFGRFETWFPNGSPKSVSQFEGGVPNGLWLLFNEAGIQTGAERFEGGLNVQARKLWADNGDPLIVENYVAGKKEGTRVFFYESRKVRLEETFADDRKNGLARSWDEHGALIQAVYWMDDLQHGRETLYLPDGRKLAEGQHVLGYKEGPWFAFYPDGSLRPRAGVYAAGERVADLSPRDAARAGEVFQARSPEDMAPPTIVAEDVHPELP